MLKDVMKQNNISQSAMARMANINQSQFNRAYNGHQPFFKGWKKRISEALGIPQTELFSEKEA